MQKVTVVDLVRVDRDTDGLHAALAIVDVDFTDADPDRYVLPLAVRDPNGSYDQEPPPNALVAEVVTTTGKGIVYDATYDREFCAALMEAISRRRRLGGPYGHVIGLNFDRDALAEAESLEAVVARTEQTNTSILYGSAYILKLFRKIEPGINPDLELGRVLNTAGYEHVPTVAGALEYRTGRSETSTLALLQELVPHESEAWTYTLDVLGRFYEKVLGAQRGHREEFRPPDESPLALSYVEPNDAVREQIGNYLDAAALLGARTAEMHVALASNRFDPALRPEPITALYQRSVHQAIRTTARRAFQLLRRSLVRLSPELQDEASAILEREDVMLQRFHTMLSGKPTGMRIRCHGDFHLGQVLYTGRDFVILDFEGEPARPLSERRIKRSPLRDVAGMLRSFHYATHAALSKQEERGAAEPGSADHAALEQAGAYWYTWVTATYLSAYRDAAKGADFLPAEEEYATLLEVYLLDKAAYEVSYELNNRPDWLHVPLRGIRDLLVAGGLL